MTGHLLGYAFTLSVVSGLVVSEGGDIDKIWTPEEFSELIKQKEMENHRMDKSEVETTTELSIHSRNLFRTRCLPGFVMKHGSCRERIIT